MATILVIDDDPDLLASARRALERAGYDVRTAANGSEALRHFAGDPTDLVVTDILMPDMDGIEFIMRLRATFPETPIIAMSGGGMLPKDTLLAASQVLGAVHTLSKPFAAEQLTACVAHALGKT